MYKTLKWLNTDTEEEMSDTQAAEDPVPQGPGLPENDGEGAPDLNEQGAAAPTPQDNPEPDKDGTKPKIPNPDPKPLNPIPNPKPMGPIPDYNISEKDWKDRIDHQRRLIDQASDRINELNKKNKEWEVAYDKLKIDLMAKDLKGQGGPYQQTEWGYYDNPFVDYNYSKKSQGQPQTRSKYRNNNGNNSGKMPYKNGDAGMNGNNNVKLKLTDYMPRRFDGVKNVEGKAHMDTLNDYFAIQGIVDDRQKVNLFKLSLEGQARIWLDPIKEMMPFNQLSIEFIKHFTGITSYQSNLHRFRSLRWNETESLELYKQKLLLLSQIIGNEKPGESYSKELKTQFKLGLPLSYQTHMTDLDEDSPLDLIVKRAQTLWDTKRLNQTTAGQVTFADTTTGLGMVVQNNETEVLKDKETNSDAMVQKLVYALEGVFKNRNSTGMRGNSTFRFQDDRRSRPEYRNKYSNDNRNTFRDSRSNSRDRFGNNGFRNRSRENSWERGRSRERRDGFRGRYDKNTSFRQNSWSPNTRRSYEPNNRSRENSQERRFGSPGRSPSRGRTYKSVRERDPTPNPKRSCFGCKSTSHQMRECPVLYKDLKEYFGGSQS